MEKTFSKIEISVIKSAAKSAAPFVAKKQKLEAEIKEVEEKVAEQIKKRAQERIEKLEAEKANYQSIIDSLNESVKKITGGYTTEDLIEIKKEPSGSTDPKTGKEIFKTVYALKYPETVIPTEGTAAPAEEAEGAQNDNPQEETAPEEMPEELQQEAVEVAEEAAEADPFAGVAGGDADPFAGQ